MVQRLEGAHPQDKEVYKQKQWNHFHLFKTEKFQISQK
jgi:hypothetical protein